MSNDPAHEETIRSERGFDGKLVHVRVDHVRLPSGRESVREVVPDDFDAIFDAQPFQSSADDAPVSTDEWAAVFDEQAAHDPGVEPELPHPSVRSV